ncbi:MAG TPA: hypothetical protein VI837_07360 [Blastocatellia bacterium]|nr:hypothetical protein [Blastocatellia bacterium]
MRYYCFVAKPKPESAVAQEYGGAYVNCWVSGDDPELAESEARAHIDASGWRIEAKEEDFVVCTNDDIDDEAIPFKKGAEQYYKAAQEDGACYVFHTWPLGTDEAD